MSGKKKVFFLVPYPVGTAPSQRFRVELFLPELVRHNISYHVSPFMDLKTAMVLYKNGYSFLKMWGLCKGFLARWWNLFFRIPFYDYIFIHREAAPIGPPVFEWVIAKFFKKRIVYDFDDAIWIPNTSSVNHFINRLRASWKVKYICKWAWKVTVGNDYLLNYARKFNQNVIKIPTCVNLENGFHNIKHHHDKKLSVGWTGSHSTLKYLNELVPVINELQKDFDFTFLVIADKNPMLPIKNFQFIRWNACTEQEDILKLDIGVMPLVEDAWSEGKCGFKLIQYYASGIPAVASPVGINKTIIQDGINGFLCISKENWQVSLRKLLTDKSLREKMGLAGWERINKDYSIRSQVEKFIQSFS
jgi:glycosyltransferase involved in cell wall biosynthesis